MARQKGTQTPLEGAGTADAVNSLPGMEKPGEGADTEGIRADGSPVYTAEEYAAAAGKVFGGKYSADIILAAFRMYGVKAAGKTEAVEIIKKFAEQEVK